MAKTDRYKKLFSNTLILGIGTFSSKVLTFLLMPLYTSFLTNGEYGIVDLLVQAANLLIPVVSLGMNTAVLRFGMDGETDRRTVLSTGLAVDLIGFGVFLLFAPLISMIPTLSAYTGWIYVFVLSSMLHYLFAYFVKTLQKVRLFAVCSVIGTAITLLLDVLFLAVWKIGVIGYLLAIILSDVICTLLLTIGCSSPETPSVKPGTTVGGTGEPDGTTLYCSCLTYEGCCSSLPRSIAISAPRRSNARSRVRCSNIRYRSSPPPLYGG